MKKEYIKKYYNELSIEIKSETNKASQILWFLGILIFIWLSKLSNYDNIYKISIFIFLTLDTSLLLYTILGKWKLWHPKLSRIINDTTIEEYKQNYKIAYKIRKEKHTLNNISTILTILLFSFTIYIMFFLK